MSVENVMQLAATTLNNCHAVCVCVYVCACVRVCVCVCVLHYVQT